MLSKSPSISEPRIYTSESSLSWLKSDQCASYNVDHAKSRTHYPFLGFARKGDDDMVVALVVPDGVTQVGIVKLSEDRLSHLLHTVLLKSLKENLTGTH